jgi:hypothetical protein
MPELGSVRIYTQPITIKGVKRETIPQEFIYKEIPYKLISAPNYKLLPAPDISIELNLKNSKKSPDIVEMIPVDEFLKSMGVKMVPRRRMPTPEDFWLMEQGLTAEDIYEDDETDKIESAGTLIKLKKNANFFNRSWIPNVTKKEDIIDKNPVGEAEKQRVTSVDQIENASNGSNAPVVVHDDAPLLSPNHVKELYSTYDCNELTLDLIEKELKRVEDQIAFLKETIKNNSKYSNRYNDLFGLGGDFNENVLRENEENKKELIKVLNYMKSFSIDTYEQLDKNAHESYELSKAMYMKGLYTDKTLGNKSKKKRGRPKRPPKK